MIQNQPILIVEDDATAAEKIRSACRECGYESVVVNDSSHVLDVACKMHPMLILSDTAVPGLDGFETARRIRKVDSLKETKVVAMTQQVPPKAASNQPAFDGYMVKPIRPQDISEVIKKFL